MYPINQNHFITATIFILFLSKLINAVGYFNGLGRGVGRGVGRAGDDDDAIPYCYTDPECGPSSPSWGGACKTGTRQSPINLEKKPRKKPSPSRLEFSDEYNSQDFWIINNGHTIQISLEKEPTSSAQMTGDGLERPYIFAQIHFHWGHNSSTGSEHTLNGEQYPLEIHFVHYDSKYESLTEAVTSGDATSLAVVGIYFDEGSKEEVTDSAEFNTITDNLPFMFQEEVENIQVSLDLQWMLPKKKETFFKYAGSLTTPTCAEQVVWFVVEEPRLVRAVDIQRFRHVLNQCERVMGLNYRPVQPLGKREVAYLVKQ